MKAAGSLNDRHVPEGGTPGVARRPAGGITVRALILSLLLIPINARWIAESELIYWMFPTYFVPFYNTIVIVFVLALGNQALRKTRWSLTTAELFTVFIVLNAASALMSHNMMEILVFSMPYAARFGGDGTVWAGVFNQHIPSCLLVNDPIAVKAFYEGGSSVYVWQNIRPWLLPAAIWIGFVSVLAWVMVCLTSILRKQWIENERLTFPVVPMYVDMIDERGSLFRNRTMWWGFAIAGSLTMWNACAYVFPQLPAFPYKPQPLDQLFQAWPWTCLIGTRFGVLFSTVAIGFLMPLDLSMSCWIYYLVYCAQRVLFTMYALREVTGSGTLNYVGLVFGTYVGVFILGAWLSKDHLKGLLRMALQPGRIPRAPGDPLSPREAVFGLLGGLLVLGAFAYWIGMALWVVPLFFLAYVVISVMISRIRAEFSFPVHDLHWMGPQNALTLGFGSSALGPGTMSAFSMFYFFNRVYASHPMPHHLEALKMSESTGTDSRTVTKVFMLAIVLGAVAVFWVCLDVMYTRGAATAKTNGCALGVPPQSFVLGLNKSLQNPSYTDTTQVAGMGIGVASALGLGLLRRTFFFFPFHPLGLAMAPSWAMWFLWLSMLVGSVAKLTALKFGGLRFYRKAVPWFIGALLGEFIVAGLWTVAGIIFNIRTYAFFE